MPLIGGKKEETEIKIKMGATMVFLIGKKYFENLRFASFAKSFGDLV